MARVLKCVVRCLVTAIAIPFLVIPVAYFAVYWVVCWSHNDLDKFWREWNYAPRTWAD